MFNTHSMQEAKSVPCKRDLEMEASRLKKHIETNKNMLDATTDFISSGPDLNRDDGRVLYAIVGSLSIRIPEQERRFNSILKQIEEERK